MVLSKFKSVLGIILLLRKPSVLLIIVLLNSILASLGTIAENPSPELIIKILGERLAIPDYHIGLLSNQLVQNFQTLTTMDKVALYSQLYLQFLWFLGFWMIIAKLGKALFQGESVPFINVLVLTGLFVLIIEYFFIKLMGIIDFYPFKGIIFFLLNFKITIIPFISPIAAFAEKLLNNLIDLVAIFVE